jgi:hypothetical protein
MMTFFFLENIREKDKDKNKKEKIRKRMDIVVAFTQRVLNIVSTGKHVSQLRVLT